MIASVTRRAEFDALRANGKRARRGSVRVTHANAVRVLGNEPTYQLAFAINRKFGCAVDRNRAKRRLKAAFVLLASTSEPAAVPPGMFLIIPTRRVLTQSFGDVVADLRGCIDQLASKAPVS